MNKFIYHDNNSSVIAAKVSAIERGQRDIALVINELFKATLLFSYIINLD